MKIINVHQAKTHLSRILDEVADGKEVILAKAGKPMAVLSPFRSDLKKRKFFQLEGQIKMAADFNQTPKEFVTAFSDNH